jgi:hypothetical protein
MKSLPKYLLALLGMSLLPAFGATAQDTRTAPPAATYSAEELDNLVASIALYPDPILAQILVAATFPDQIAVAATFVRENGTNGIEDESWDVSVKAVAHYPPVLNMMAERPDWTTALGQAYAAQSSDVMKSVQHLREMAQAQGNLKSTPQQNIVVEGQNISIVPAQPTVIYVPTYDPAVVYYRPIGFGPAFSAYWSFGIGFPIGAWLAYDCDWYGYSVFYSGWGSGWRLASRPFFRPIPIYVRPRYTVARFNRDVLYRPVNYGELRRFNTVHRLVDFVNRANNQRDFGRRGRDEPRRGGREPYGNPRDGRVDRRYDAGNGPRSPAGGDARVRGREDNHMDRGGNFRGQRDNSGDRGGDFRGQRDNSGDRGAYGGAPGRSQPAEARSSERAMILPRHYEAGVQRAPRQSMAESRQSAERPTPRGERSRSFGGSIRGGGGGGGGGGHSRGGSRGHR